VYKKYAIGHKRVREITELDDYETEWLERYIYHKQVVEELKEEQADDV
jgi:hypothetical protein